MCFLKTNVEGSLFKFWWFIVGIEKKNLFEKNIFILLDFAPLDLKI